MLKEGTMTTMKTKGCSVAYLGTTEEDVSTIATITKGLTKYAERQTATDKTIHNLTDHTAFLVQKIAAWEQQLHAMMAAQGNTPPPQYNFQPNIQQIQTSFLHQRHQHSTHHRNRYPNQWIRRDGIRKL